MKYRFEYLPYRRKFRQPLATAHGSWEYREGIVIRLEEEAGGYAFGEIAPLPWFGTERVEEALSWCKEVGSSVDPAKRAPTHLPCCNWALYAAEQGLKETSFNRSFAVAALVTDEAALAAKQKDGFKTFKVKIGISNTETEQPRIDGWVSQLEDGQRLRLDANGGLRERDFKTWLEWLEGKPIEFLEQPLEPGLENRMLEIAEPFSTPIALDESISGFSSLTHWQHWPGPLVVKPSLLGWVDDKLPISTVCSAAFETAFGFESNLRFLSRHQESDTPIGFDTNHLLEDDGWSLHGSRAAFTAGEVTNEHLQTLWEEKRETIS